MFSMKTQLFQNINENMKQQQQHIRMYATFSLSVIYLKHKT